MSNVRESQTSQASSLTKLIYLMSAAGLISQLWLLWGNGHLLEIIRKRELERLLLSNYIVQCTTLLTFVLLMGGMIAVYARPGGAVFWRWDAEAKAAALPKSVVLGVAGGLAASVLATPLLGQANDKLGLIAVTLINAYFMHLTDMFIFVLLVAGLPIVSEIFFRGIVLRIMVEHSNIPAGVLASSLLFSFFWPVFPWSAAVILGLTSGALYYRTRTLTAPIIANAVMILSSVPLAGAYRWLIH